MNNDSKYPLTKLKIFSFSGIQMRTFHITWLSFFFCFFGWFGIAPLMPVIRQDLGLNKEQIGNLVIISVLATVFARVLIGRFCDSLGPRLTYTLLLSLGAVPLIFVGLSSGYESLLFFRFLIGIIGASFVITQYHTSVMFAPNVVGTANAVTGGWGNLGAGVTNMAMPLIFTAILGFGFSAHSAWRIAMVIPGVMLLILAYIYFKYTKDTPAGNFSDTKNKENNHEKKRGSFLLGVTDYRTWLLFVAYAASFGIEITFDNVAALYFVDNFHATLILAGILAGVFGFMNIFARALGGIFGDKVGSKFGIRGKGILLGILLALEGLGIMLFAAANVLVLAIISMLLFALFLKMANGTNYSIVPFIRKDAIGSVSGIVGAGGNLGAVVAGFLFKSKSINYNTAFIYIGTAVLIIGLLVLMIKFERNASEETVSSEIDFENAM